jgi:small subunit ribosomal protein S4
LCRRYGEKLFLKGEVCLTNKCSFERRGYAPGEHGQRRPKVSEYGLQLREKQKARIIYGVLERQFRNYFRKAESQKGITGENLLRMLECRLDNVCFRLGFGQSRPQARQLILHGHILVNGKQVNIPSCLVKAGDEVRVREKSKELDVVKGALERVEQRGIPPWMLLEKEQMKGTIAHLPAREDITVPINEQLIVELYSK